ncbi:Protein of unknown function [Methylomagnum ishizawai]|uniref:DUF2635 domain-containing protein n=1 Tax=Methylomagnum ishizawai TaxID=1760988 RepID=A0A1Y6CVU3_9GAMM|nr:DUF2635 domain-containing protein [Methylomagnum ishizawai]SMF94350.1 Protein of unknown function [Methylomagnum ishizawai]
MPRYVPAPGLKVRAKNGPVIPPAGIEVNPNDSYYYRHIQEGALVAAPTDPPTDPPADPPAPARASGKKAPEPEASNG